MKYKFQNEYSRIKYNVSPTEGILKEADGVSYIEFPTLSELPFIKHGFSTRLGGVSKGHLGTMNLSYSRGDIKENVDENYRRICKSLGICEENLVLSDQIHEVQIYEAGRKDVQGKQLSEKKLQGIDGLITKEADVVLCTSYADCVPLFFVDRKKKAIGLSHSGWRGTVGKIGAKTVGELEEKYKSRLEDIVVVIGPSICQECYEISAEVAAQFENLVSLETLCQKQPKIKEEVLLKMKEDMLLQKSQEKYQLDLWRANQLILMEKGIPWENISVSGICTCCNPKLLFSHRASHGKRGNLSAFLTISVQ